MTKSTKVQRLFLALWPNDAVRAQLAQWADRTLLTPCRPIAASNFHITLVFLGNIDIDQRRCVSERLAKVNLSGFALRIDELLYKKRGEMLWAAPTHAPSTLMQGQSELARLVMSCGIALEARAYYPHINLARRLKRKPSLPRFEPIEWSVDHFCLVASKTLPSGVEYEVLETWSMTATKW